MNGLRVAVLLAATVTTGLMAGVYGIYSNAFMPGLGKTDDKTFVGAFQAVDRAILNPLFLIVGFVGSLVLTLVAALLSLGEEGVRSWVAVAFVLNLITVIITIAINVPLNDALKAAGDPATIDVTAARTAFNEARWRSFNLIRSLLSTVAFGLLAWSLYLTGKAAAQP